MSGIDPSNTTPTHFYRGPILLATRAEADELEPVRIAGRLAAALGVELVLLYVAVEAESARIVATQGGLAEEAVEEEIMRDVRDRVAAFAGEWLPDREVRILIGRGEVVSSMVEHARSEDAEMVVVGHHEHGVLARLFQGDPAHDLLERSPCPVLVVPLT